MGGFSTLNTAISGLRAAQRGLDVTGQNVVNANTPGYSRQVVRQSAVGSTTAAAFHTANSAAFFGGVNVDDVSRIRDSLLEAARVTAGSSLSAMQAQSSALENVQQILSEPGDTGLQSVLDEFYSGWQDLANQPESTAAGSVVINRGQTVASQLRFTASGVAQEWGNQHDSLKGAVGQVNVAAKSLAGVNQKILEGTVAGRPVNELLDQRDQLVRNLGDLIGARATVRDDNVVDVQVNGMSLVAGVHAQAFSLTGATRIQDAPTDPPTVLFGNVPVPVQGGQIAGLMAATRSDLPNVTARLDVIANGLRDAVNTVHGGGFTLDGTAGGDFFTGTGALDMQVAVTADSELAVAAAPNTVDGSNALKIGDLAIDAKASAVLGGADGPSASLRGMAVGIGVQVQSLQRSVGVQASVVETAESAVEGSAGVNLDEEMSSLLMYQRSYQASARVITAVDEMLNTLVNLGR